MLWVETGGNCKQTKANLANRQKAACKSTRYPFRFLYPPNGKKFKKTVVFCIFYSWRYWSDHSRARGTLCWNSSTLSKIDLGEAFSKFCEPWPFCHFEMCSSMLTWSCVHGFLFWCMFLGPGPNHCFLSHEAQLLINLKFTIQPGNNMQLILWWERHKSFIINQVLFCSL